MSDESHSTERNRNLWAPWRMEYIDALSDHADKSDASGASGCFLCRYRDDPANDRKNLLLWRGRRSLVVLNRFPYTGGHSMVAPLEHAPDLASVPPETMLEMFGFLRDLQAVLTAALHCEGFNVGINIGRCAGAGLPGHLHVHLVPRWSGDTNFMAVFGDVRVVPQSLQRLYDQILGTAKTLGLPKAE